MVPTGTTWGCALPPESQKDNHDHLAQTIPQRNHPHRNTRLPPKTTLLMRKEMDTSTMTNLDDMLAKRPINPATLEKLQAEIRQEIQREQLAKALFLADNYFTPRDALETDWNNPELDYLRARYYQHADVTIALGWTPPPTPTTPTFLDN